MGREVITLESLEVLTVLVGISVLVLGSGSWSGFSLGFFRFSS